MVLFQLPYSLKFGFHFNKNVDCNTSWIYYRLFENTKPIDVAFIGTSHTGCGVNDSLIEKKVDRLSVANLAYCTKGRNIHYLVAKQLIETKKPKIIFLEVMEYETVASHKDFPLIANNKALINSFSVHNLDFYSDLVSGIKYRFYFNRNELQNSNKYTAPVNSKEDFNYTPFHFTADSLFLAKSFANNQKKYKQQSESSLTTINYSFPESYAKNIAELAKSNGIKIYFLYLPSLGNIDQRPLNIKFYESLGEVLIPPKSIYYDKSKWVDGEHFNYEGSKVLSNWLADVITQNR